MRVLVVFSSFCFLLAPFFLRGKGGERERNILGILYLCSFRVLRQICDFINLVCIETDAVSCIHFVV